MKAYSTLLRLVVGISVIILAQPNSGPRVVSSAPLSQQQAKFQWPFPLGESWMVVGGFSDGSGRDGRTKSSPHYYKNGGALDISPRKDMKVNENTDNMFVVAADEGDIAKVSACFVRISHSNGITSEYYHLDKVQVKEKDHIRANQILGILARTFKQATCSGGDWKAPHLHFTIRGPQNGMEGFSLSHWVISYDSKKDKTSFTRGSQKKYILETIENKDGY